MPVLETERLRIRPYGPDDLEAADVLFRALGFGPARRAWLEWARRSPAGLAALYQPPYGDRALVLRETGAMIGQVGLVPSLGPFGTLPGFGADPDAASARRNVPEVGLYWGLAPEHRGRGYATEAARALIDFAFAALNLRRIVATTEYDNTASQAVMRQLGMRVVHNPYPEPPWFQVVGVLDNPEDQTEARSEP